MQVGDSLFNNEKLTKTVVHPIQKIQLLVENQMV